jgi:leucyl aminopeptidase
MATHTEAMPLVSSPIEFTYQSFDKLKCEASQPIILFAFEEEPDPVCMQHFPEAETLRLQIEKKREVVDDMTHFFPIIREGLHVPTVLVYIGQQWRSRKTRKSLVQFGSISFYIKLRVQMCYAVRKLRDMGFNEATVVLPGKVHLKNLKKDPRGEREEEAFVRTIVESIVSTNPVDMYRSVPRPQIRTVCLVHHGMHDQTVTHFFNRVVGAGVGIGTAVAETRRLTRMSPSRKTPLKFAGHILGTTITPRTSQSPEWRRVTRHSFGSTVHASIVYGTEGLQKAGFGLISAVGQGSRDEPCFLKLHYTPAHKSEKTRVVTLIGKGVIMDTGGLSLKTDGSMGHMHYDMAGAATVASVFRLAVEQALHVELVVLLPLVENAIGSRAVRLHDIVRAYDGQTVEITDTDSEGRLIIADAIAYSEKRIKPHLTVTVATLSDMSDFGPDFLKVLVEPQALERYVRRARERSFEKYIVFPPLEHLGGVDDLFTGTMSDIKNEHYHHYQAAGMVFLSRFFHWNPSPWLYVDVASVFESDADDYGSGPGFGVRFLWQFIKQFART